MQGVEAVAWRVPCLVRCRPLVRFHRNVATVSLPDVCLDRYYFFPIVGLCQPQHLLSGAVAPALKWLTAHKSVLGISHATTSILLRCIGAVNQNECEACGRIGVWANIGNFGGSVSSGHIGDGRGRNQ